MLVILLIAGIFIAIVFGKDGLSCLGAVFKLVFGVLLLLVGASIV